MPKEMKYGLHQDVQLLTPTIMGANISPHSMDSS